MVQGMGMVPAINFLRPFQRSRETRSLILREIWKCGERIVIVGIEAGRRRYSLR